MSANSAIVGVIGGSGVYSLGTSLSNQREIVVETPFGRPSDAVVLGELDGIKCAFIPRHGRGHKMTPTQVPYQANIYALKALGCKYLVTISAVGSLKEEAAPGDLMLVDQLIDRTMFRRSTFFDRANVVGHVSFAEPTSEVLRDLSAKAITRALPNVKLHRGGCLVGMEGPAFSTKAESKMHQIMGGDIIGMTAVTECKLAREAEMANVIIAMVTDYDAWRDEDHHHVDVAKVVAVLKKNAENALLFTKEVIREIGTALPVDPAHTALDGALMNHEFSNEAKEAYGCILERAIEADKK